MGISLHLTSKANALTWNVTVIRVTYKNVLKPNNLSKCLSVPLSATKITLFVTPNGTLNAFLTLFGIHNIIVTLKMVATAVETCRWWIVCVIIWQTHFPYVHSLSLLRDLEYLFIYYGKWDLIISLLQVFSFLVNKTNRYTEFQFYWYYDSTCFGQPFCPSSGGLSRTSALVHFM